MFFGGAYLWAIWAILLSVEACAAFAFPCIGTCSIRVECMLVRPRCDVLCANAYADIQSRLSRLPFSELGVGIRTFSMQMEDKIFNADGRPEATNITTTTSKSA